MPVRIDMLLFVFDFDNAEGTPVLQYRLISEAGDDVDDNNGI